MKLLEISLRVPLELTRGFRPLAWCHCRLCNAARGHVQELQL